MIDQRESDKKNIHPKSLGQRTLQGCTIAIILIVFILSFTGEQNSPNNTWILLPLVIVPASGALGGIMFYLTDRFRNQSGWKKTATNVFNLLFYIFVLIVAYIITAVIPN